MKICLLENNWTTKPMDQLSHCEMEKDHIFAPLLLWKWLFVNQKSIPSPVEIGSWLNVPAFFAGRLITVWLNSPGVCGWGSSAPPPNMSSETMNVCSWMLFSQSAAWRRGKSATQLLSCRDHSPSPEQSCGWKQFEFSEGQCGKVLLINLYPSPGTVEDPR